MKILNPTEKQVYSIKSLFLSEETNEIISIAEEDLDNLFRKSRDIYLYGVDGDNMEEAANKVMFDEDLLSCSQVVLRVVISGAYPIVMSEMNVINNLIGGFSDNCVIIWGFGRSEKQEANVRIVMLCGK